MPAFGSLCGLPCIELQTVNVGHERNCIAKIVLSQFAVPEQLSRLIVSTGFLDHDPIVAALLALAALASGNKGDEKRRGEQ
jgi:hypothetical protein